MTMIARAMQLRYVAGGNPARKVTWLELFFDLVFVAAVAQVGEPLREDLSPAGVLRFTVLFILIWWAWIGGSVFATRFDTDDAPQRLLTLLQMFAVAVMAANADEALGSRSSAGFAAAYAVVRFVLVAQYARARHITPARGLATHHMVGHGVAAALWLLSALLDPPLRFAIWAIALAVDLGTPWMAVRHSVAVPPDAAHLPERFGLFTLILLGESVVAVMHGMKGQEHWSIAAGTAAFLGMGTAFVLWWWYFDAAAATTDRHIRSHRDAVRFQLWSFAHLPLYLGIAVTFAAVERIVHDGAVDALHGTDTVVVGLALTVTMAALVMIAASSVRSPSHSARIVCHLGVAIVPTAIAVSGAGLSGVAVVIGMMLLYVAQLSVAASGRRQAIV